MFCTSLGSLLRPLFYFLCSILLIHRVLKIRKIGELFNPLPPSVWTSHVYAPQAGVETSQPIPILVPGRPSSVLNGDADRVQGYHFEMETSSSVLARED